ncbi:hypothetical protein FLA105534_00947 [Flavobacterium bizetiae]|uniref:Uncharacterized protein n=1 Tax=Flavobacterium bizetiae TaxID=2704140 RepID=A0A6J4GBC5_9FLAO|nr:hypothetical protein FLA105534_00947 [Flavobacterium bizetiae]CAD5341948.1 hypothetical protein FLA105535_01926 [Flavobacterium bizetiae]CAD5346578.1 hypothetical protein FLA105534_00519 [Flavobacterium bizetiae]
MRFYKAKIRFSLSFRTKREITQETPQSLSFKKIKAYQICQAERSRNCQAELPDSETSGREKPPATISPKNRYPFKLLKKTRTNEVIFGIFAVLNIEIMNTTKIFARMVRWRYWKQLQRVLERRRTANPYGFYIS